MARTLPWLKSGQPTNYTSRATNSSNQATGHPAVKRRRVCTPSESEDGLDLNTTGVSTPDRKARLRRRTRTPSTSPPPAPLDEEPMREGFSADDIWIMVEDEFRSTAQLYTKHMHHAEYQRLKALAKKNEDAEITRPIDARTKMPASTQRQMDRNAQDKKASEGMHTAAGKDEDPEPDDPWLRDPHLAGLMESPRKPARLLKSMGSGRSNTRAAAGFAQGSQQSPKKLPDRRRSESMKSEDDDPEDGDGDEDGDDNDDDLDAPVKARGRVPAKVVSRPAFRQPIGRDTTALDPTRDNIFQQNAKGKVRRERDISPAFRKVEKTESLPMARKILSGADDDPPKSIKREDADVSDFLARRRERAAKKERDEKRRTSTTNEIPTFLF